MILDFPAVATWTVSERWSGLGKAIVAVNVTSARAVLDGPTGADPDACYLLLNKRRMYLSSVQVSTRTLY